MLAFAFGAYWLLKTFEFHQSQIERKAVEGTLTVNPRSLTEEPDVPDNSTLQQLPSEA
jgi:hypothetical protein